MSYVPAEADVEFLECDQELTVAKGPKTSRSTTALLHEAPQSLQPRSPSPFGERP